MSGDPTRIDIEFDPLALGVTFPFNLAIGIPVMLELAKHLTTR